MSLPTSSDALTTPDDGPFDVSAFSKELQMIVSFAILDLDVIAEEPLVDA